MKRLPPRVRWSSSKRKHAVPIPWSAVLSPNANAPGRPAFSFGRSVPYFLRDLGVALNLRTLDIPGSRLSWPDASWLPCALDGGRFLRALLATSVKRSDRCVSVGCPPVTGWRVRWYLRLRRAFTRGSDRRCGPPAQGPSPVSPEYRSLTITRCLLQAVRASGP